MLRRYPRPSGRASERPPVSDHDREVAGRFGYEYFDGERRHGYGGYKYHPRYWTDVVLDISSQYRLASATSVLDVGCAKGFMLRDLKQLHPHLQLVGIDVSTYALQNADQHVSDCLIQASADSLPFPNDSFDLVIAINSLHNLPHEGAGAALSEIARVSRRHAFVMVDGWNTISEKVALDSWVLTAKTVLHEQDWLRLFSESGYDGDYWFWKVDS